MSGPRPTAAGNRSNRSRPLHQIRYHVEIVPYDWTWNIIAVITLIAGAVLPRAAYRHGTQP